MAASQDDLVLRELNRAAILAGRPGVAIVADDASRADRVTGARRRTQDSIDRLATNRRVRRLRRGVLLLVDETGRQKARIEDAIAAVAAPAYLIAGGRALEHHDLTDQHFFGVVTLTDRRVSPFEMSGEKAEFLLTDERRLGDVAEWAPNDPRSQWKIATAPRAVLDAISHPRFGVSFSQGAHALVIAARRDPSFLPQLFRTVSESASATDARRLGLLIDRLLGPEQAAPLRALRGGSRTPVLLRAGGPDQGPVDATWRVIVNQDLDLLEPAA
jgi:predicted transcriptional regulator of viral defense system